MEGFEAFARALSSEIAGLRGCLIATRDGRVLGVHPTGATAVDEAWRRIARLRACTSMIARFERETWSVAARGSHVALAVVAPSIDAADVISHMERLLAEAGRVRMDAAASTAALHKRPDSGDDRTADEGKDVDRAALVQEFSGLLQDKRTAADG
jgi:hypothetical protein